MTEQKIEQIDPVLRFIENAKRLNYAAYQAGLDEDLAIAKINLELAHLREDGRLKPLEKITTSFSETPTS
jgi:hypothetical protein